MSTEKTLDDKIAARYLKHGLVVSAPKGNSWWGESMVCAEHDEVPYCMDTHDGPDYTQLELERKAARAVARRETIIQRHHEKIKAVYNYCKALDVGDVWVLCGGGAQLQAFFGNKEGYLAILYLDLVEIECQAEAASLLESCGLKTFTMQVNGADNDKLFENRFRLSGVELRTHHATYGAED